MRFPVLAAALFAAGAAQAADDGFFTRPAAGCMNKSAMARAHDLREQEDMAAARLLIDRGFAAGDCRWFAAGEPVIVEDGDILAGLRKVRSPGDPTAYWAPDRAIETR